MDLTFGNDGFIDKFGVCTSRIVGTMQYAMGRQDISFSTDWDLRIMDSCDCDCFPSKLGDSPNSQPARSNMITAL